MGGEAFSSSQSALESDPQPAAASRVRELHAQVLDAVLSRKGLQQVAELTAQAAGGPVLIVAPELGGPFLGPRDCLAPEKLEALELELTRHLRDPSGTPPREIISSVPIAGEKLWGLVALLRSQRAVSTSAFECLRVAALAGLTEAAMAEARNSRDGDDASLLISDLRNGREDDRQRILRRAAALGCDLGSGALAVCAAIAPDPLAEVLATIGSEFPEALAVCGHSNAGPDPEPRLFALVPGGEGPPDARADLEESALVRARSVSVWLGSHGTVGLSSYCLDPGKLPAALQEAESMLEVLLRSDPVLAKEMQSNGTYRLLFRLLSTHPGELKVLCRETVAPLMSHDHQYHAELVTTLETYLGQNCNMNATAAKMFAHRHTIAYRLDRIKELTGLDPGRSEDRERLGLGLKAYHAAGPQLLQH